MYDEIIAYYNQKYFKERSKNWNKINGRSNKIRLSVFYYMLKKNRKSAIMLLYYRQIKFIEKSKIKRSKYDTDSTNHISISNIYNMDNTIIYMI